MTTLDFTKISICSYGITIIDNAQVCLPLECIFNEYGISRNDFHKAIKNFHI